VEGLQHDGVPLVAALWVREPSDTGGDNWLLWLSPQRFLGRMTFYTSLANVLTRLQPLIGYFEIANVRAIDPAHSIVGELRRFGRIRPDHPRYLYNENFGGNYVSEAVVLYVN
jgi:hypothetical protein